MLKRVVTGIIMILALVLIVALGGVPFALVAALALSLSAHEMFIALKTAGHRPVKWPFWAGSACMVLGALLIPAAQIPLLIPAAAAVCLVTIALVFFRDDPKLEDALLSVMPFIVITMPGLYLFAILRYDLKAVQVTLYTMIFSISIFGDTLAYFVGSQFGKRKFCPAVSPKKTVAGAVAGLLGSLAGALATGLIAHTATTVAGLPSLAECAVAGLAGGLAAQMGDLFASLIKRHCGVKDFSGIFPGHGGMMDRMDSILFVTVAVFCCRILFRLIIL